MRVRILSFALTLLLMLTLVPSALAVTAEELNQDGVFLKQERSGTCTLASTAMMLRRAAMRRGDVDWSQITEQACREAFWINGVGLPHRFTYDGMTVSHGRLPGGGANRQILSDMLAQHPEGIVIHATGVPHAVLLTDCIDGVFYCADPAQSYPLGRIPVDQAYGTRVENSFAYWSVVATEGPKVVLTEIPRDLPAPTEEESALFRLVEEITFEAEKEPATCLLALG